MVGVSLVGFSGSLIKDTLHQAVPSLVNFLGPTSATAPLANEPIDEPEATKVVIGICSSCLFDYLLLSLRVHTGVFFILFAQILCARMSNPTFMHLTRSAFSVRPANLSSKRRY